MEKRLLLAIALSFLVLGVYTSILPKKQIIENKEVMHTSPTSEALPDRTPVENVPSIYEEKLHKTLQDNELHIVESSALTFKFSKTGGHLYEVFDKKRKLPIAIKNIGLVPEWEQYLFSADTISGGTVFTYKTQDGLEITKTFRSISEHVIEFSVKLSNLNNYKSIGYDIFGGSFNAATEKDQMSARYYESCALVNGITIRKPAFGQKKQIEYDGRIGWAALRDRYFCTVISPQFAVNKAFIKIIQGENQLVLSIPARSLDAGKQEVEDKYNIYIGVQDEKALRDFTPTAERLINFGTFDGISKVLLFFLKMAYRLSRNWGTAIILITIFIYILTFPLSFKSMMSMKKMQALQPKIEALRSKLKDNPQKLNTEIMALYREEKANPFGGCLPMLLQIPVFFALYQLLMRFIGLNGAKFLWIKDLSQPDRAHVFNAEIPVFGNELNILPILMAIGMFFQQKITASQSSASPETAQQQKIMAVAMPVIFGFMFYKLSSGLVLYWFVNSLLMLVFQWKISKIKV